MKIVLLSADGMLGHKAYHLLRPQVEVFATFRSQHDLLVSHPTFACLDHAHLRDGVDAHDLNSITKVIAELQPQVVIDCIGIVKQREEAKAAVPSILVNALFPINWPISARCTGRG